MLIQYEFEIIVRYTSKLCNHRFRIYFEASNDSNDIWSTIRKEHVWVNKIVKIR